MQNKNGKQTLKDFISEDWLCKQQFILQSLSLNNLWNIENIHSKTSFEIQQTFFSREKKVVWFSPRDVTINARLD